MKRIENICTVKEWLSSAFFFRFEWMFIYLNGKYRLDKQITHMSRLISSEHKVYHHSRWCSEEFSFLFFSLSERRRESSLASLKQTQTDINVSLSLPLSFITSALNSCHFYLFSSLITPIIWLDASSDQFEYVTNSVVQSFLSFIFSHLGWPIAIVVCVSIGLASVLVLYLVVRIRSGQRHRRPTSGTGDDLHSQMEWEDDIGLNITINPLDETKVSTSIDSAHHFLLLFFVEIDTNCETSSNGTDN